MESHSFSKFQVNLPYPQVDIREKNTRYAMLLRDDFAGAVSEFTAIAQYSFNDFVLGDKYPDVAETFKGISITEMRHLEFIGETILKLGLYPVYRGGYSSRGSYWNGSYVEYGRTAREALLLAIDSEKKAIQNYQKHIRLISEKSIQELLYRIIMDEELHLKIFDSLLRKYAG